MSLNLNPWFALLLGILIGWILEWLLELWFFRRRRLECQRRLASVEAQLRTREEELRRERAKTRSLEDQLAASLAAAAAAASVAAPQVKAEAPAVEVAAPEIQVEAPAVEVAAPEVQAEAPAVEVAAPEVEAELPAVEVAAPEVEAELPAVEVAAPEVEAELPAVEVAAPEVEAELPAVEVAAPEVEAELPAVEVAAPEVQAEAPAVGDDLTLIVGVGRKTAAALAAAGITSFGALAETAPERLDEITRQAGLQPTDYAAWIAQARRLAEKRSQGIRLAACPQDLGRVKGIGSVYETKLYAAGIGTFWELANTDDAELRRILDIKDFQKVDLGAIKETARSLAEATGTVGLGWSGAQPDDFEPLQGIGPVFERRLYDAGICTYEALANATVEQLAEICKAPAWRVPDYASWIAQAKELLAQRGR